MSTDDAVVVEPCESCVGWPRDGRCADLTPAQVALGALVAADSPRRSGEDDTHVRLLADSDAVLPPILVHRPSMRIIDGMHRLRAAMLRGEETILVRFFEGDDEDAFVLAVKENVTHGLPLTLADRTAAAVRIIRSQPAWSDRAVAAVTSLSAKTVAAIRRRATEETPQLHARVGRDGRSRPLDASVGRQRASELIAAKPDASLREIAREAGVSPGTVRSVRERIRTGVNPVSARRGTVPDARESDRPDVAALMSRLRQDPSIRFNESGRSLLRMLDVHAVGNQDWQRLVNDVPAHCADAVSALARMCADQWLMYADLLDRRAHATA
ncbi:ParB/RepB/Spo0J family partition protein [Saccharothrix sp. ALI-22-I]|uniref:ParB/RepB/Spo0J family partition protein n=1 Tax=Saccharothrix sp. ALI-22-I TaxID=1933778 RepID=UPI001EE6B056|nr:ParB N-terminal domain-containing protein [Saccharothrix sp. ALI-22-I]